jgi:hypothetical protein
VPLNFKYLALIGVQKPTTGRWKNDVKATLGFKTSKLQKENEIHKIL